MKTPKFIVDKLVQVALVFFFYKYKTDAKQIRKLQKFGWYECGLCIG